MNNTDSAPVETTESTSAADSPQQIIETFIDALAEQVGRLGDMGFKCFTQVEAPNGQGAYILAAGPEAVALLQELGKRVTSCDAWEAVRKVKEGQS